MTIAEALLHWYDRHARELPWRNPPGAARPGDAAWPYRVWLSEVMLQQTTVAAVKPYFAKFIATWPSIEALAAADEAEVMSAWAGLGYYSRARNLVKCAREVAARGGFPQTEAELRELPGLGPYTAAAIAAIAFGEPAVVVDANVERAVARLFAIDTPLPAARGAIRERTGEITPPQRAGDDGPRRHDLYGARSQVPALPTGGGVRGQDARRSRTPAGQGTEESQARAGRACLLDRVRRRSLASHPSGRGHAWRDACVTR